MRFVFAVLPCLMACASAPPTPVADLPLTATLGEASAGAEAKSPPLPCPAQPGTIGRIEDAELNEISGVVESHTTAGVFFVHNDSGDSPRFFAIDRQGQVLAELELARVPIMIDAEDIAAGPAPGGGWFVYLGDTGNNFASMGLGIPRRKAVLYRVAEPRIELSARGARLALDDVFPITFTFPSGARDVEAFFVDPRSGDLFMIGKQHDGHSQILSASAAMLAAGGGELRLEGELLFGRPPLPGSPMPTSASISQDGSAILIRTYSSVFLFRRPAGENVAVALARPPRELRSPKESQGESIGFAEGDTAYLTISEGIKPVINCARIGGP